ncbi:hypothetical protein FGO68_gene15435 [Halteria grandinella]|uniref:Uncharacterized protein n=1 Tax=Halteria grandinella TaxID=5974 RepID=A0A8J8P383_HALGN|nr:hypothetical protein FGO68_gene15435 [Halteria grandinella]
MAQQKAARNTDQWLTTAVTSGPGTYDHKLLPVKESFNYGQLAAFGSNSFERQRLKGSALQAANLEAPGPGAYLPDHTQNQFVFNGSLPVANYLLQQSEDVLVPQNHTYVKMKTHIKAMSRGPFAVLNPQQRIHSPTSTNKYLYLPKDKHFRALEQHLKEGSHGSPPSLQHSDFTHTTRTMNLDHNTAVSLTKHNNNMLPHYEILSIHPLDIVPKKYRQQQHAVNQSSLRYAQSVNGNNESIKEEYSTFQSGNSGGQQAMDEQQMVAMMTGEGDGKGLLLEKQDSRIEDESSLNSAATPNPQLHKPQANNNPDISIIETATIPDEPPTKLQISTDISPINNKSLTQDSLLTGLSYIVGTRKVLQQSTNMFRDKRNSSVKKQIDEYLTGLFGGADLRIAQPYELQQLIQRLQPVHECRRTGGKCESPLCTRGKMGLNENSVFISLSNRSSIIPQSTIAETPGPGYYIGSAKELSQQKATFGSYSKRETDAFMKRNLQSPFKNQTNYQGVPPPAAYHGKKHHKSLKRDEILSRHLSHIGYDGLHSVSPAIRVSPQGRLLDSYRQGQIVDSIATDKKGPRNLSPGEYQPDVTKLITISEAQRKLGIAFNSITPRFQNKLNPNASAVESSKMVASLYLSSEMSKDSLHQSSISQDPSMLHVSMPPSIHMLSAASNHTLHGINHNFDIGTHSMDDSYHKHCGHQYLDPQMHKSIGMPIKQRRQLAVFRSQAERNGLFTQGGVEDYRAQMRKIEESNRVESSVVELQTERVNIEKRKQALLHELSKQPFTPTIPRFKDPTKRGYKILRLNSSQSPESYYCPILGINTLAPKEEREAEWRGPGAYEPDMSIDQFKVKSTKASQQDSRKPALSARMGATHFSQVSKSNKPGTSSFLSMDREYHFQKDPQVKPPLTGVPIGAYHNERSFLKKTFNVKQYVRKDKGLVI